MVLAKAKTHMFDDTDLRMVLQPPRPPRDIYGTKGVVLGFEASESLCLQRVGDQALLSS